MLRNVISDQKGRYTRLRNFHISEALHLGFSVQSIHGLAWSFFTSLKQNITNWELSNEPNILCGDWSVVINNQKDRIKKHRERKTKTQKDVLELMNNFELEDVCCDQEAAECSYTWSSYSKLKQARLDYFLVSTDLTGLVELIQTSAAYRTDHSLVDVNMIFTHQEKGRGFWKFNNSSLSDPAYVKLVPDCINETAE